MTEYSVYWLITAVPALPLFLIFFAFQRVLDSKKFELEMLLERGEALTTYLAAYGSPRDTGKTGLDEPIEVQIESIVGQVFRLHYPGAEYAFALAFSTVAIILVAALGFASADIPLGLPTNLRQLLHANQSVVNVVAGGTGAFVWSIYELVERYRSRDLAPESFFSPGLRIIVVSAVGAMVGTLANERIGTVVAFGVGALPLSSVLDYTARRTRKQLGVPEPSAVESHPSFNSLQGWDAGISQRLGRAGVTSVQALACANQFELYLRTNIEWRIILDLSDQALLAIYIGDRLGELRPFGIRTAVELAELDWSEGEEYFKGIDRDALIKSIATALKLEELQVRHLIRSVSNDATVDFLASLWSDEALPEDEETEATHDERTSDTPPVGTVVSINSANVDRDNAEGGSVQNETSTSGGPI